MRQVVDLPPIDRALIVNRSFLIIDEIHRTSIDHIHLKEKLAII